VGFRQRFYSRRTHLSRRREPGAGRNNGLRPDGGNARYKITVPAYAGYTYEIYGNPTLVDLEWRAMPFSITQMGTIDRHKHTATSEGSLSFYVEQKAVKGFYKVTFRVRGQIRARPDDASVGGVQAASRTVTACARMARKDQVVRAFPFGTFVFILRR
jgi:hypothetical protein